MDKFYITTTLPYVNSKPHMGHALEFVQADVIARYQREILGKEVVFNTGTDEHGQKIYRKALEEAKDPQAYVDEYAEVFRDVLKRLNISNTHFIRTSDPSHKAAAQEFWKRCQANGDIYKKNYKIKYCVGCELEKMESDLSEEGRCPIHPNLEIEFIDEENYFFRFFKYQQPLLDFYQAHPEFVVPGGRFNEIKSFVGQGLQDFSISRLKSKMPWGVPVPGDENQVMYVWFDALINYISTLGWPGYNTTPSADASTPPILGGEAPQSSSGELRSSPPRIGGVPSQTGGGGSFMDFWPGVQIAGKDNLRQQSAMWQAMLMSAGVPNSRQIIIHGFINAAGGQKMSKSLGNVIDPMEIVDLYGSDALRYWFTREMSTFEDGEFDMEKFKESYNAGLANGIGNLTSRILKMAASNGVALPDFEVIFNSSDEYCKALNSYRIQEAADIVWKAIKYCDGEIQSKEPFKLIKTNPEEAKKIITELLVNLKKIAFMLKPFLPETSGKILAALQNVSEENIPRLFPRID